MLFVTSLGGFLPVASGDVPLSPGGMRVRPVFWVYLLATSTLGYRWERSVTPEEQDDLEFRRLAALERQATAAEQMAFSLSAREREDEDRTYQALRRPPRRLLAGERGLSALLSGVPPVALRDGQQVGLWQTVVPEELLLRTVDRAGWPCTVFLCRCGVQTLLVSVGVTECGGGCGRWLLAAGDVVRGHVFPAGEEQAA